MAFSNFTLSEDIEFTRAAEYLGAASTGDSASEVQPVLALC